MTQGPAKKRTAAQDSADGTVGQRLRQLRGEESQADFAARFGLSRAALANYELGRTKPKPSLLKQISLKVGISDDFLLSGSVRNEYELHRLMGLPSDVGEPVSYDEMVIVRTLRLCESGVVSKVAATLLEALESKPPAQNVTSQRELFGDIERLGQLSADPSSFGPAQDTAVFTETVRQLARRARDRAVPQSVPQSDATPTKSKT